MRSTSERDSATLGRDRQAGASRTAAGGQRLELPRRVEHADGRVGVGERGVARPRGGSPRRAPRPGRPSSPRGPACRGCSRTARELRRRAHGVGHRLRREDDEHAVGRRGRRRRPRARPRVSVGSRVAEDVDRVAMAPPGPGRNASSRAIVSGEISASSPPAPIRASVAMTPGPPALVTIVRRATARPGLLREDLGDLEQLADRVHAEDADAAESGVEDFIGAGERAGVGGGRLGGGGGMPALMTMIGLVSATSRAAKRNERALPIDSM